MTTTQSQIELRSANEFNLATSDGCIEQIVYGFNVAAAGYGIADNALVAYLQIEGNTPKTLILDLKFAGCPIADSTVRNRCSQLVKKGLLPKTSNAGRPAKAKVEESAEAITEAVIQVEPEQVGRVAELEHQLEELREDLKNVEEAAEQIADENVALHAEIERLKAEVGVVRSGSKGRKGQLNLFN